MRHALLLGNLLQLSIMTLLVIYAAREQGRRALIMLGLAVVLTAVMTLAGCIHQARPAVDTHVAPGCVVTEPPPSLPRVAGPAETDRANAWMHALWNACASMRAADYPAPPLYEEAGPGEESDED